MKTSELSGAALDWAVAKCEGIEWSNSDLFQGRYQGDSAGAYSTDWAHGGEIIEREKIRLDTAWNYVDGTWAARIDTVGGWWEGETPLVAAMRCYVVSKLGDEIDVPEELL